MLSAVGRMVCCYDMILCHSMLCLIVMGLSHYRAYLALLLVLVLLLVLLLCMQRLGSDILLVADSFFSFVRCVCRGLKILTFCWSLLYIYIFIYIYTFPALVIPGKKSCVRVRFLLFVMFYVFCVVFLYFCICF